MQQPSNTAQQQVWQWKGHFLPISQCLLTIDTVWLRKTSQKWWFAIVSMTEISQIWIKVALKGFKPCFLTVFDCFRGKIVKKFLHIFYIFCIFGYIFWVFRLHIYSIFWSKMLHIFPGPSYYLAVCFSPQARWRLTMPHLWKDLHGEEVSQTSFS